MVISNNNPCKVVYVVFVAKRLTKSHLNPWLKVLFLLGCQSAEMLMSNCVPRTRCQWQWLGGMNWEDNNCELEILKPAHLESLQSSSHLGKMWKKPHTVIDSPRMLVRRSLVGLHLTPWLTSGFKFCRPISIQNGFLNHAFIFLITKFLWSWSLHYPYFLSYNFGFCHFK